MNTESSALVEVKAAFKLKVVHISMGAVEAVDGVNGRFDKVLDAVERQAERVYRTLQTFEQVNAHKFADATLTTFARKVAHRAVSLDSHIFFESRLQDKVGWCVYGEVQF